MPETEDLRIYNIGLTCLPEIGDVLIRQLVAYCGGVKEVFEATRKELSNIPSIGEVRARQIVTHRGAALEEAERELQVIERKGFKLVSYLDTGYPQQLKEYMDAPSMLVMWGDWPEVQRWLSVVGTRTPTDYGLNRCEVIVKELQHSQVAIVSGLAYGIDGAAHRAALDVGLPTVAVLGNGLPRIYPARHGKLAEDIVKAGGAVVSQFRSTKVPDREHFPMRNRTVSYLTDACIVIESKASGGSMITANYAFHHHKELFAVPGRSIDVCSEGCNNLIKAQMAHLAVNGADVQKIMGWDKEVKHVQTALPIGLKPEEEAIIAVIRAQPEIHIQQLQAQVDLTYTQMASLLLSLELQGIIRQQAGNRYMLY